jgi:hypothetical protein
MIIDLLMRGMEWYTPDLSVQDLPIRNLLELLTPDKVRLVKNPMSKHNPSRQNQRRFQESGPWSLTLARPPKATLTLYQDEDAVYGTGYISLDAKTNLEVAVGGTVMGDKLDFDMITLKKVSLYRVSMTVSGNSAAGSYTAFKPGEAPSSGTIRGLRSVV